MRLGEQRGHAAAACRDHAARYPCADALAPTRRSRRFSARVRRCSTTSSRRSAARRSPRHGRAGLRAAPREPWVRPDTVFDYERRARAVGGWSTSSSASTPRSSTAYCGGGRPARHARLHGRRPRDHARRRRRAAGADTVARVVVPAGTELWLRPVVIRLTLAEVDALLAAGKPGSRSWPRGPCTTRPAAARRPSCGGPSRRSTPSRTRRRGGRCCAR